MANMLIQQPMHKQLCMNVSITNLKVGDCTTFPTAHDNNRITSRTASKDSSVLTSRYTLERGS